ncbi:MAG TPA: DUF1667 domain-containing protein [Thermotogota bacterium]|nr:DUF1667 domain-containing protein [Thermotogota bacterium]HRW92050.1 DUF1667 domain-containing protein [Thermotogota bacterium]
MKSKKMVCISCPLGCTLAVSYSEDGKEIAVSGNRCPRGVTYAEHEIRDPRRVVTSNVKVLGGEWPLASVKTTGPIPKDRIRDLVQLLVPLEISAPVSIGTKVLENVFQSGEDVVVTREVKKL